MFAYGPPLCLTQSNPQVWLLIAVSRHVGSTKIFNTGGSLNPLFRDWYRLENVKKIATVFTWNRTQFDSHFHFDGDINRRNIEFKNANKDPTLIELKKRSLNYVVVDFFHLPTTYMNNIIPGTIEVLFWLKDNGIINAETKIEFKNLMKQHISKFEKGLADLKKIFVCAPISFSDSVWSRETMKYYEYVGKNGDTEKSKRYLSSHFKDCESGKEILQFQLVLNTVFLSICMCV
jgi:hypothetical protein